MKRTFRIVMLAVAFQMLPIILFAQNGSSPFGDISTSDSALMEKLPMPGRIVAERQIREIGVTVWTLSNGVTLLLKPSKFKANEVLIGGVALGGASDLALTDYPANLVLNDVPRFGAFGRVSSPRLARRLEDHFVEFSVAVEEAQRSIAGRTPTENVGILLQTIYVTMTQVRFNADIAKTWREAAMAQLAARATTSQAAINDSLKVVLALPGSPNPVLTPALLSQVDLVRAVTLFRDQYADAGEFTFAIVGAFDPDTVRPYVERYLASLPAGHHRDSVRHVAPPSVAAPQGIVRKVVNVGTNSLSGALLVFSGQGDSSEASQMAFGAMVRVLQDRLLAKLRDEMGGTYNVDVAGKKTSGRSQRRTIIVKIASEPTRIAELVRAALAVVDTLQRVGPTAEEVAKIHEAARDGKAQLRRTNGYWLNRLLNTEGNSKRLDELGATGSSVNVLDEVTPAQVASAARQYLSSTQYAELDVVHSETAAASDTIQLTMELIRRLAHARDSLHALMGRQSTMSGAIEAFEQRVNTWLGAMAATDVTGNRSGAPFDADGLPESVVNALQQVGFTPTQYAVVLRVIQAAQIAQAMVLDLDPTTLKGRNVAFVGEHQTELTELGFAPIKVQRDGR